MSWDRLSARQLGKVQDALVREQVRHGVGAFSPYWKSRFAELGTAASSIDSVEKLETVPAAGERDVSPRGDAAGMAALVLQAGEGGFALHAAGPTLRRALRLRLTSRDAYRRLVETDTKPTSYVWSGLGFRYPLASTRGDLDVIARAGARLWRVLGLGADDALLSAVPVEQSAEHVALHYAALASGAPAMFPGDDPDDVAGVARVAPPTVLAVRSSAAVEVIEALCADDAAVARLRTLLLVGMPTDVERAAAVEALGSRATAVAVLAVHVPAGARVLWAECREAGANGGLHTYPDLDVVQLVDPETGDPAADRGEVVLTQLQLRGSALLRWRTGDLTPSRIEAGTCKGCGRTVPRVAGLRRAALVFATDGRALDLRSLAGALAGHADIADWRIVLQRRARDRRAQVVVHVATPKDAAQVAASAAGDIRSLAGALPTQMVAGSELPDRVPGDELTPRIRLRH